MNNKAPVFLHEPKCGGTTVLYRLNELFLRSDPNPKIQQDRFRRQLRLYEGVDPDNPNRPLITYTVFVEIFNEHTKALQFLDKFPCGLAEKNITFVRQDIFSKMHKFLKIKALIIAPNGVRFSNDNSFLDELINKYGLDPVFFTFLRDPLNKEQSFYYYLNSNRSFRERTHKILSNISFYDYVMNQMSDSWLIKTLHNLRSDDDINLELYEKTVKYMKKFRLSDIGNSSPLFDQVLLECGIPMGEIANHSLQNGRFNKNPNSKSEYVEYEDLPDEIKTIFFKKKYWESKLYNELSEQNRQNSEFTF